MPAQNLDQRQLLEVATKETRAAFEAAILKYPNERFYAFCLYTDNDVSGVFPTANTVEGIDRIYRPDLDPDRNYWKWNPAEWEMNRWSSGMDETNKLLHGPWPAPPTPPETPETFGARKHETIVTLTTAL